MDTNEMCMICLNDGFDRYTDRKFSEKSQIGTSTRDITCSICGKYKLTKEANEALAVAAERERYNNKDRAAVSHQMKLNTIAKIENFLTDKNEVESIFLTSELPSPRLQALALLNYMGNQWLEYGVTEINLPVDIHAIIGSLNRDSTRLLVKQQFEEKLILYTNCVDNIEESTFRNLLLTEKGVEKFELTIKGKIFDKHGFPIEEIIEEGNGRMIRDSNIYHGSSVSLHHNSISITEASKLAEIIEKGESENVEFKSTLRINLHTGIRDENMEFSVLKTIAGFLNTQGGLLFVGVKDDGEIIGIERDNFKSPDKMSLHLTGLIERQMDSELLPFIHPYFEKVGEHEILVVCCEKGHKAAFVSDNNQKKFFIRAGNSTIELKGEKILNYANARFK